MLRISPLFSDGAVLCRGKELRIFGEAEDGARVHCELRDGMDGLLAQGDAVAADGRFLILLAPQEARTGCRLLIADGEDTFCALDISVGEVFLAGGQSNMEMSLKDADEGETLIRTHVNPMVRYFNVPAFSFDSPERDEAWKNQRWQAIGPGRGADISAAAYFFAMKLQRTLGVPVGIIGSFWGGSSVTCWMDEDWLLRTGEGARYLSEFQARTEGLDPADYPEKYRRWQEDLDAWNRAADAYRAEHPGCDWDEVIRVIGECPWQAPEGPGSPFRPGGLYETMIAPLTPLSLTGCLYYQGEEDTARTDQYDVLMASLIARWRTAFEDEGLPFLFVQLPMFRETWAADSKTWPALRLRQSRVRDWTRNTAMACLLDEGELGNIHPLRKRVVGERLCDLALSMIYGQAGEASPRVIGKRIQGSMMTLLTDQPLLSRDGREPALLELAGADGNFVPARAMIEGSQLHLTAAGVAHPLHCRYAWTDYGIVNLAGGSGLPLEPFAF